MVHLSRQRLALPPGARAWARPSPCASRLKGIAKPTLLLTCILCLSQFCFADGKVFPPVAFPANVTIPDQRALIHFTNGMERLVIETRFSGAGTNFAWVVPFPAQPVIEEATTGLFPTLQYLFRPQIRYNVPQHFVWLLVLAWLSYVAFQVRATGRLTAPDVAGALLVAVGILAIRAPDGRHDGLQLIFAFLVFLDALFVVTMIRRWNALPRAWCAAMFTVFMGIQLLPFAFTRSLEPLEEGHFIWGLLACLDLYFAAELVRYGPNTRRPVTAAILICLLAIQAIPFLLMGGVRAKGMAAASSSSAPAVSVLARQVAGIFETTTITSKDPAALQTWLRENGFTISTNSEPVIASYVRDGWVFVAAKVRRDKPDAETSTPHPLSFTFKTEKPVYPMRLTGVDNGPLQVELYVFSRWRAEAAHFKVEDCTQPSYPPLPSASIDGWSRWSPETPSIVHPLLRKWVGGAPVVTKLTARLTPEQMRKDVWLEWTAFSEKRTRLFSRDGALTSSLNWGVGALAATLLGTGLRSRASERSTRKRTRNGVNAAALAGACVAAGVFFALPKTQVRLVRDAYASTMDNAYSLCLSLLDSDAATSTEVGAEARRVLSSASNDARSRRYGEDEESNPWDNALLGGTMREEDSPGNYTIRETNGQLQFIGYDAQGAEHVFRQWPRHQRD